MGRLVSAVLAIGAIAACAGGPPGPTPAPPPRPTSTSTSTPTPTPTPRSPAAATPEARVRSIIAAQIAAGALDQEAARDDALRATFTDDAVISNIGGATPASELSGDTLERTRITELQADGNAEVVWFVAGIEDTAPPGDRSPTSPASWRPRRYAGVAARSRGWKVVAASLVYSFVKLRGSGKPGKQAAMPNATAASGLTSLVLDGAALAAAAPPSAIVVGTGEHDVGRGRAALGDWGTRTLALDPNGREVRDATWGTAQANVVFSGGNLGLFAVALPKAGGGWTPVLIQYIGQ